MAIQRTGIEGGPSGPIVVQGQDGNWYQIERVQAVRPGPMVPESVPMPVATAGVGTGLSPKELRRIEDERKARNAQIATFGMVGAFLGLVALMIFGTILAAATRPPAPTPAPIIMPPAPPPAPVENPGCIAFCN